jgi:hypothetical protein
MRKACVWVVAGMVAAAVLSCDSGGNGGTGPTPAGEGPGVWFGDSDSTAHKLSLAGAAIGTAGGFV